jgi:hypothetical protein
VVELVPHAAISSKFPISKKRPCFCCHSVVYFWRDGK